MLGLAFHEQDITVSAMHESKQISTSNLTTLEGTSAPGAGMGSVCGGSIIVSIYLGLKKTAAHVETPANQLLRVMSYSPLSKMTKLLFATHKRKVLKSSVFCATRAQA